MFTKILTRTLKTALGVLALLAVAFSSPGSPAAAGGTAADAAPGQILVKFRESYPRFLHEATISWYGNETLFTIPGLDVYVAAVPAGTGVEEMTRALSANPGVLYAEPNRLLRALDTPNDPLFIYQYALSNTGQVIGDVPGSPRGTISADIKATAAWAETKGLDTITVAVVDSGVEMAHPDLAAKLKSSGRDFVNNDYDASDDYYHGTFVAGIVGAETNNNEGIAGVAWNCKILPVKVLDDKGVGTTANVVLGIQWAADNGADVINLSLGAEVGSETLRQACKYAFDKGIVIVASGGNTGADTVMFPAAYDNYVLAVAATDYNDARAAFSNTGAEIDVAAPGVHILSTVPTWLHPSALPYAFEDGTSAATPHVSGLAALIKGLKPFLTPADIMNVIRYSADDVNSAQYAGKDAFLGYGRINMEKALAPLKIESAGAGAQ